jgi:hypothetical protein
VAHRYDHRGAARRRSASRFCSGVARSPSSRPTIVSSSRRLRRTSTCGASCGVCSSAPSSSVRLSTRAIRCSFARPTSSATCASCPVASARCSSSTRPICSPSASARSGSTTGRPTASVPCSGARSSLNVLDAEAKAEQQSVDAVLALASGVDGKNDDDDNADDDDAAVDDDDDVTIDDEAGENDESDESRPLPTLLPRRRRRHTDSDAAAPPPRQQQILKRIRAQWSTRLTWRRATS